MQRFASNNVVSVKNTRNIPGVNISFSCELGRAS